MVGIAPDYRTKERFGTSPLESVSDGRAALHWIEDHADKLGIDPKKSWSAALLRAVTSRCGRRLNTRRQVSATNEVPLIKPFALILVSPVSGHFRWQRVTPQNVLATKPRRSRPCIN